MDKQKSSTLIPELLAPAGSYEGFMAALGAGADAVYVGGSAFGARAYAKNFSDEELLRAIDTAHIHGRKLYLTVNTLVKNREMESSLLAYLAPFVRQGLDAVLVQDMGVLRVLHAVFPDLPLHASTQMAVTGPMGMRFLKQQGICRVVPARELSLRELEDMKEQCPQVEIETFVHGALCYSYSGLCLLSSLIGGRSGNRGRCAQPCRLPYRGLESLEGSHHGSRDLPKGLISMKDLNTLDILPELVEAGIASLKIEGRMKQPAYAAGVVAIYRRYLDLIRDKGSREYQVEEEDRQILLRLFSRGGSCMGYYHQHNSPEMIFYENGEKKEAAAKAPLPVPKRAVKGSLSVSAGSPMTLSLAPLEMPEAKIRVAGDPASPATNRPASIEDVRRQMEKLGESPFCFEELKIEMEDGLFLPVKSLNTLRRKAVQALEDRLTSPYRRELKDEPALPPTVSDDRGGSCAAELIYVSCENERIAALALAYPGVAGVYVPIDAAEALLAGDGAKEKEIYLTLPYLVRDRLPADITPRIQALVRQGLAGFLVHNLEGFALIASLGWAHRCVLDHSLYSWNDQAVSFWKEQKALRITAPLELSEGELRHRNNHDTEMVVYGYLPVMVTAQCVRQTIRYSRKERPWCDKGGRRAGLIDRYGNTFPSSCVCRPWKSRAGEEIPCYNVIYNSLPLDLSGQIDRLKELHMKSFRLVFTLETEKEALAVLEAFLGVRGAAKEKQPSNGPHTKGHFHRGVE